MPSGDDKLGRFAVCAASRHEPALECRRCGVICERVVSPWRCLQTPRGCVYAFVEGENTYFGCLHKVFSPELDMAAFAGAGVAAAPGDPYGVLRVVRTPRPQCPVTVESAYAPGEERGTCVNPAFIDDEIAIASPKRQGRGRPRLDGRDVRPRPPG